MARARNIKPAIMANEDLADLEPLTRLLFIYLWMLADREGRLEDRPRRIGAEALPYDGADVDGMLDALAGKGFIARYRSAGERYIQVLGFAKHQNPHVREAASTIPAMDESDARHNLGRAEHSLGSDEAAPRSPDSLIPDSLIPDSLIGDKEEAKASLSATKVANLPPPCPHEDIVRLYHEILPANPGIKIWDGSRADALRTRWREDPKRQSLEYWERFFRHVAASPFLTGKVEGKDGRVFLPGLEWLVKASNFAKVIEGRYHERKVA